MRGCGQGTLAGVTALPLDLSPSPPQNGSTLPLTVHGAASLQRTDAPPIRLERKQAGLLAWLALQGATPRARLAGLALARRVAARGTRQPSPMHRAPPKALADPAPRRWRPSRVGDLGCPDPAGAERGPSASGGARLLRLRRVRTMAASARRRRARERARGGCSGNASCDASRRSRSSAGTSRRVARARPRIRRRVSRVDGSVLSARRFRGRHRDVGPMPSDAAHDLWRAAIDGDPVTRSGRSRRRAQHARDADELGPGGAIRAAPQFPAPAAPHRKGRGVALHDRCLAFAAHTVRYRRGRNRQEPHLGGVRRVRRRLRRRRGPARRRGAAIRNADTTRLDRNRSVPSVAGQRGRARGGASAAWDCLLGCRCLGGAASDRTRAAQSVGGCARFAGAVHGPRLRSPPAR